MSNPNVLKHTNIKLALLGCIGAVIPTMLLVSSCTPPVPALPGQNPGKSGLQGNPPLSGFTEFEPTEMPTRIFDQIVRRDNSDGQIDNVVTPRPPSRGDDIGLEFPTLVPALTPLPTSAFDLQSTPSPEEQKMINKAKKQKQMDAEALCARKQNNPNYQPTPQDRRTLNNVILYILTEARRLKPDSSKPQSVAELFYTGEALHKRVGDDKYQAWRNLIDNNTEMVIKIAEGYVQSKENIEQDNSPYLRNLVEFYCRAINDMGSEAAYDIGQ